MRVSNIWCYTSPYKKALPFTNSHWGAIKLSFTVKIDSKVGSFSNLKQVLNSFGISFNLRDGRVVE